MRWKETKKKILLGILMAALATGMTGCKTKTEDKKEAAAKGRYVEQEKELPAELKEAQPFWFGRDGKDLVLIENVQQAGATGCAKYVKASGADSFQKEEDGFVEKLSFDSSVWNLSWMKTDGGQEAVFAMFEQEDSYWGHLYTAGKDGSPAEITPAGWKEPIDYDGYAFYDTPQIVTAVGETLAGLYLDRMEFYDPKTGELQSTLPLSGNYLEKILTDGQDFYLFAASDMGSVKQVEHYRLGSTEPVEIIPVEDQAGASCFSDLQEDGTLVIASEKGVLQYQKEEKQWKLLIQPQFTSFSMSSLYCLGFATGEEDTYWALFGGEGTDYTLVQYVYDPDMPTAADKVLTVYTVNECPVIKQAAALYMKQHPDVEVRVETELSYDEMYSGSADMNSINAALNAKILAGEGPDILVLDELNGTSFAEKGLLMDLSEVVTPLEESGELLTNITKDYREENGSVYMIPLRFGLPLLVSRELDAECISSLENMADIYKTEKSSVMGIRTTADLVAEFSPFFIADVVQNKTLNKEALKPVLEQLKVIADNCGIVDRYDNEIGRPGIWDIASTVRAAFYETKGYNETMLPYSAAKLVNGTVTCFENTYIPVAETGIYKQTAQPELAQDFLSFVLSEAVQNTDFYDGFPINSVSLKNQAGKDRSDVAAYTTIQGADGTSIGFDIQDFDQAQKQKLVTICEAVNKKAVYDEEINQKLTDAMDGYLKGERSLEETVDQIEAGLRMYLAE